MLLGVLSHTHLKEISEILTKEDVGLDYEIPFSFQFHRFFSGGIIITRDTKVDRIDALIEEIAQRILLELESASSTDLSDVHYSKKILHLADITYAKRMLQQLGSRTKQSSGTESEIEKRAVIKVLLFSTWLNDSIS